MKQFIVLTAAQLVDALKVCGLDIPHARLSPVSRALDGKLWPPSFPYDQADLTPDWAGKDQLFYVMPKFAQHAGDECRRSLTRFYECALPPMDGDVSLACVPTSHSRTFLNLPQTSSLRPCCTPCQVLDLCSSFTSHYPEGWKARRCVALGLNPLELAVNPSKTEWLVQVRPALTCCTHPTLSSTSFIPAALHPCSLRSSP